MLLKQFYNIYAICSCDFFIFVVCLFVFCFVSFFHLKRMLVKVCGEQQPEISLENRRRLQMQKISERQKG